jgi:23S rRNA (cytidine1920-2'-O)/16S rRNA (cytidine1409-2'-O)-methyltransferase
VRSTASIRVLPEQRLRGAIKLSHALDVFEVRLADRVAVDIGASTGGFTVALLEHGVRRVYAVDAGVGQLLGRLRADSRVVNLEGHNLGSLDSIVIPEPVAVITMDLSYLAVADAVPQLESLTVDPEADLVALVKPTFELHRATLAASVDDVANALHAASKVITATGWDVLATCDAPATGRRGAREAFIHARRRPP